jgi:hypothetical protein
MWLQAISARICAAVNDRSERPKASAAIGNAPFQTAILGGEPGQNIHTICRNATRYEKVIGATIPMSKNHLLLVSFDAGTNNNNNFDSIIIMEKIVPLIKEYATLLMRQHRRL